MKRVIQGTKFPIKVWTDDIEFEVENQLRNLANMPFIHKHVAVMPDVHLGIGAAVGTVIPTVGAIIPAAVGVDIGCGMCAVQLPIPPVKFQKEGLLRRLRLDLESVIPAGNGKVGEHSAVSSSAQLALKQLGGYKAALDKMDRQKVQMQLGTLGGGNHFLEICLDTQGGSWVLLHSGSRNIGNRLANYHIDKAKRIMREENIVLPDPNLAYFTQKTPEFQNYIHDLLWAQKYAKFNRLEMMTQVLKVLIKTFDLNTHPEVLMKDYIDCHHNYTEIEHHFGEDVYVTRKGAVRAREGDWGIIPGSMGAKSYIVQGKGHPESFSSCSHGAGRKMSRNAAQKRFTEQDLVFQTQGVECRKDRKIVDEIPAAYKNIDEVMKLQNDLVEIKYELKQILCIKGS